MPQEQLFTQCLVRPLERTLLDLLAHKSNNVLADHFYNALHFYVANFIKRTVIMV